jgi:hypothetical protein
MVIFHLAFGHKRRLGIRCKIELIPIKPNFRALEHTLKGRKFRCFHVFFRNYWIGTAPVDI